MHAVTYYASNNSATLYRSDFFATQLKSFKVKLTQTKPSQSSDQLDIFGSSQQCLHSLSFFKQLDLSYKSISEHYDKVNLLSIIML